MDPENNVLLVANLFNFKIDGDQPRRDHELFLSGIVAPKTPAFVPSSSQYLPTAPKTL